ncbi:TPA: DUF551 domain-containing protein [Escherichia coli]
MTTMTKERLLTIKQWRETYGPGSNVVLPAEEAEELARIALASLEAKSRKLFTCSGCGAEGLDEPLESKCHCNEDGAHWVEGIVYTAQPAQVSVPDAATAIRACIDEFPESVRDVVEECASIAENTCRAAMLHGAEPVSQTYNLPQTHFEQVADLYEMQFDDGRTCAFHTDAQKAAQWLRACDGNRVQEYVKLERLQNAISGNSPVIPDGWISCSERMPEKNKNVLISVNFDSSLVEPLICSARYTGSTFRRGDATIKPGNGIEQATHWMPLPEPPQEAK